MEGLIEVMSLVIQCYKSYVFNSTELQIMCLVIQCYKSWGFDVQNNKSWV